MRVSRGTAGSLGFLSSWDGDMGEPLKLQKGVKPSFELQGELCIVLESLHRNWTSSRLRVDVVVFLEL